MIGLDAALLGGALLPLGLFGLYHFGAASSATLLLAFQVGLNLPHYFQTYSLTYLNPAVRGRRRAQLGLTLAVAILAPITAILLGPTALRWTLAFIALWAFFHITQQTRGLMGLYLRRAGGGASRFASASRSFLYTSTAAVAADRIWHHGPTLAGEPLALGRPAFFALLAIAAIALAVATLQLTRTRLAPLGLAVGHTGVMALSMSVQNLSVALALATSWHALQYLALTFVVQREAEHAGPFARLARNEIVLFFGVALAFGFAAALVGDLLPSPWGQAIYLPLLLAHYLSDGWLWRPDRNPLVREWLAPVVASNTA